MKQLWLVGRCQQSEDWELIGIFSSEERAVAACTKKNYFITPVKLDEVIPDGVTIFPGSYFPLEES